MAFNLRGRSFVKEIDFSPDEWNFLLGLASQLKSLKYAGAEVPRLSGRNVALLFEKTSTRTRCAFEVAAHDQGARVTYLDPAGSQVGHKESIADTARVLGRMYDGIQYRGAEHAKVESLARHAGVPVWNGLTDQWHPTQSLCDMLTMREHAGKPDREIAFAYVGDARNNVGNSLLVAGAMTGMDVRMVAPQSLLNDDGVFEHAQRLADRTGARLLRTDDLAAGVRGVDFVCTDVWVSMGEPHERWEERIEVLRGYQVNAGLLRLTGNDRVRFMHCLPALHNRETTLGERLYQEFGLSALEVTDEVFESRQSIVFDQAENRLHTIKAVLVATMGG